MQQPSLQTSPEKRGLCPVSDVSEARHSQPAMGQEPDPQTLGGLCSDTRGLENTVKIPGFQALLQGRDAAVLRMAVLLKVRPCVCALVEGVREAMCGRGR